MTDQWFKYGYEPIVMDDGRTGSAQFNRSAAYNRGVEESANADMLVFSESDMLIDCDQLDAAIDLAAATPGLVIPFSEFRALSRGDSEWIRVHMVDPADCATSTVRGYRGSIGAINVLSRETYDLIGRWDEAFEGAWFDDDAMKIAFDVCAGPTRWVDGPAYHLYHESGGRGDHLSESDRRATSRNRLRYRQYQRAKTADQIRALTG